jgi:ABC-type sulfate transport system substrate-binding protein
MYFKEEVALNCPYAISRELFENVNAEIKPA